MKSDSSKYKYFRIHARFWMALIILANVPSKVKNRSEVAEMNRKNILCTIAIPTYKRPKYLRQAIDSAINQKDAFINYDIIVVNNDPDTDMTEFKQIYQNSPVEVRFYNNKENIGMLGNVNRCVDLADGKWIAFLHDDDLLLPNYMHEIGNFLNMENVACFIPRRYLLFDNDTRKSLEKKRKIKHIILNSFPRRWLSKRETYSVHIKDNVYSWQNCYGAPSCGAIYNIEKIKKCGLFFPENTYSWDFISFLKLNYQYDVRILNQILSVYRMSTGASLRPEVQLDFFKIFESLKRQLPELNAECANFIEKFSKEMSYINTSILSNDGKRQAKEKGYALTERRSTLMNHIEFIYLRLQYFSTHHLDVEVPLTRKGRQILQQMGVLQRKN